ncbi:MAG: ABC transporter substrate-binding protein [Beijerinckiaceae bacterium]|nr:ABC transporter substrate-binding protein [Beijerinckiaceae bacterium]
MQSTAKPAKTACIGYVFRRDPDDSVIEMRRRITGFSSIEQSGEWGMSCSRTIVGRLALTALLGLGSAFLPLSKPYAGTIRFGATLADEIYLAPIFAAEKLGLFEKAGIVVTRSLTRSIPVGLEALAAGQVDIIDAPGPAAAIAKSGGDGATDADGIGGPGLPGKIVATNAAGFFGWTVIVNAASGFQSLADLRGKKIGIGAAGSLAEMAAELAMERGKVDFDLQAVGAGALIPMLRQKSIDAVIGAAMLTHREVERKRARIAYDLGLGSQSYTVSTLIASNTLMQERPAELRAFLAALAQALERMQIDRKYSIELLKEYTNIADARIVERMFDNIIRRMTPGYGTDPAALKAAERLAARAWKVKGLEKVDPQSLFTNSFLPIAK